MGMSVMEFHKTGDIGMAKHSDLTGARFGKLTVRTYAGTNEHRQALWEVVCDCGSVSVALASKMKQGCKLSCGCSAVNKPNLDMVGKRFGRLVVTRLSCKKQRHLHWHAKCDCGKEVEVSGAKLRYGHTLSCGCLQADLVSARATHGMSKSRTYQIFKRMWQRCTNPNTIGWENYGGRGITVCERWRKFENFLLDMGECPDNLTIERVNNDAGYSPDNCKWATRLEQAQNKRQRKDRVKP